MITQQIQPNEDILVEPVPRLMLDFGEPMRRDTGSGTRTSKFSLIEKQRRWFSENPRSSGWR